MGKLANKILELEQKIQSLESKIIDLSEKTDAVRTKPESMTSQIELSKQTPMPSSGTGLGKFPARQGGMIFNDGDASATPWGTQPPTPIKGYNKHGHSRYAGGALDIHTLELVEFESPNPEADDPILLDQQGNIINKHCQSYWKVPGKIAKSGGVEKIGKLDIQFDSSSKKWLAGGIIDVERTNLVLYEVDPITGAKTVKIDTKGQEMKAPMYGSEENTQNIVWDENAKCWRFYAVYADSEE